MQFIILTRRSDGEAVYVNPKQICFMGTTANNDTLIQFCGEDANYIQVKESPKAIAELCRWVPE